MMSGGRKLEMNSMRTKNQSVDRKKQAVEECIKQYSLPLNSAIDDSVLSIECFPQSSSQKN
jgi:hypothetical protein